MRKKLFLPFQLGAGEGPDGTFHLVKPLTFMNNSGSVIPSLERKFPFETEELIIICDNLDLPEGTIRLRKGGSHAGHNGLKSLIDYLGGQTDFLRLYIGIGRPDTDTSAVDHVLGVPENPKQLNSGIVRGVEALTSLLKGAPIERVMNEYNRKPKE